MVKQEIFLWLVFKQIRFHKKNYQLIIKVSLSKKNLILSNHHRDMVKLKE
jgi:hypothetical protein